MKKKRGRLSQNDKILKHLKKGKKISPLQALRDFGCMRLAARVFDLRERGNYIVKDSRNQAGTVYAVYRLVDNEK